MTLVQEVYFTISIIPSLFFCMNTGMFGQIYKLQGTESVPVTIKTTKKTLPESEMASFMEEAAIKLVEATMHSFFQDGEITVM